MTEKYIIQMKYFIFIILSVFFISSCVFENPFMGPGVFQDQQDSCEFMVDAYTGQSLRWDKSQFPIIFKVHASVPREAELNFISAVDHWNLAWSEFLEIKGLKPFNLYYVDPRGRYEGEPGADGSNLLLFEYENFSKYNPDQDIQAITTVWSKRRAKVTFITDTDILVNTINRKYYYDDSYNNRIQLAKKDFEIKRFLASSKDPGRFVLIMENLKSFFNLFLKLFKKPKKIRQIANYRTNIPRDHVDFPSLMVHELGHVPGRKHYHPESHQNHFSEDQLYSKNRRHQASSKDRKKNYISIMEPRLLHGRTRRNITEYDLETLFCAYYNY